MLTVATVPVLFKIVSKIDMEPIIERLKNLDVWDENAKDEDGKPIKVLSREKVGVLTFEIFSEITPQLGKIGNDILELVSVYKDIPIEEAKKLDLAEVINEIINDEGVVNFFKRVLEKKIGHK